MLYRYYPLVSLAMKRIVTILSILVTCLASLSAQQKFAFPEKGTKSPKPIPQPFKRHQDKKTRVHGDILTGADQTELYLDYLEGKNIGMVLNQTSVIGKNNVSSLDSLVKLGVHI